MSATPRTDEAERPAGGYSCPTVPARLARELEIEVQELRGALQAIQAMAESRKACIRMPNGTMLGNFCRVALAQVEGRKP